MKSPKGIPNFLVKEGFREEKTGDKWVRVFACPSRNLCVTYAREEKEQWLWELFVAKDYDGDPLALAAGATVAELKVAYREKTTMTNAKRQRAEKATIDPAVVKIIANGLGVLHSQQEVKQDFPELDNLWEAICSGEFEPAPWVAHVRDVELRGNGPAMLKAVKEFLKGIEEIRKGRTSKLRYVFEVEYAGMHHSELLDYLVNYLFKGPIGVTKMGTITKIKLILPKNPAEVPEKWGAV